MNKIIFILFIFSIISILVCIFFYYKKIELYNSPTINIIPKSGLSNRLRTILGYRKKAIMEGKTLKVFWNTTNKECLCHFYDLFEPINNVVFINKNEVSIYHFVGQKTYQNIVKSVSQKEIDKDYIDLIKPKLNIQNNIDAFIKKYDIPNTISIHVRRTDHISLASKHNKYTSDIDFDNFIKKYSDKKIFLSTDNDKTQEFYKNKYPDRILIYEDIKKNNKNLRKTSIENAVIDIFIASKSKFFKPSGFSSFSEVILSLRYQKE